MFKFAHFRGASGFDIRQCEISTRVQLRVCSHQPVEVFTLPIVSVKKSFKHLQRTSNLVNKTVLGVVGGSCGVNQAIQAGRRHREIKTLVLLSGGTDAEGEAFIKSSAKMAIFGAASEEDTNGAASIKNRGPVAIRSERRSDAALSCCGAGVYRCWRIRRGNSGNPNSGAERGTGEIDDGLTCRT
jgi:hypothetical protein